MFSIKELVSAFCVRLFSLGADRLPSASQIISQQSTSPSSNMTKCIILQLVQIVAISAMLCVYWPVDLESGFIDPVMAALVESLKKTEMFGQKVRLVFETDGDVFQNWTITMEKSTELAEIKDPTELIDVKFVKKETQSGQCKPV